MPLDDDNEDLEIKKKDSPKIGVKFDNKNSILGDVASKKNSKEEFVNKANEVNNQLNTYSVRAVDLASKFKKMLDDKSLEQNKTIFAIDSEKDLLGELVQLGIDMNVDEYEKEGMGSMGLIMLLFRTVLIQRDKINLLDYNLNLLEKKVKSLTISPVDTKK